MGQVGPGSGGSEVRDSMGLLGLGSGIRWLGSGGSGVWWVRECSVVQVQDRYLDAKGLRAQLLV